MLRPRILGASLAIALVSALAPSLSVSGISGPISPSVSSDDEMEDDVQEFAKYEGIDLATARLYLERQPRVGELEGHLGISVPAFAGMYLVYRPEYRIVVLSLTGDSAEIMAKTLESQNPDLAPYIEVRKVDYSLSSLQRTLVQIRAAVPKTWS